MGTGFSSVPVAHGIAGEHGSRIDGEVKRYLVDG